MRLNLGAGSQPIDGYVNLDGKNDEVIFPLDFKNVSEIRASHVLEHFGHIEAVEVLADWIRCLKSGGVLKIAVPDFDDLCRRRALGEGWDFESIIMGGQCDERDYHKSIWNCDKLMYLMTGLGLVDICTWQSEIQDCASYPFSLNLMGYKK